MTNEILQKIAAMFPQSNLKETVNQTQNFLTQEQAQGTKPNKILEKIGLTEQGVNDLYSKYGNDMRAKAVLGMLGTSPEQLKSDALGILQGHVAQPPTAHDPNNNLPRKFPRLK